MMMHIVTGGGGDVSDELILVGCAYFGQVDVAFVVGNDISNLFWRAWLAVDDELVDIDV